MKAKGTKNKKSFGEAKIDGPGSKGSSVKSGFDFKIFGLMLLAAVAIVILAGCINNVVNPPPMVGNDSDIHGCRASAGYSWCQEKQSCVRSWEENCSRFIPVQPSVANRTHLLIQTEEFPPYNFLGPNGTISGHSSEVVSEILRRTNQSATIELVNFTRAYNTVQNSTNVMFYSMGRTPARENLFKWVGPVGSWELTFYSKKGSNISITKFEDAKTAKKICVVKDDVRHQLLLEINFTNIEAVNEERICARKLIEDQVDVWFGSSTSFKGILSAADMSADDFLAIYPVRRNDLYLAFSKDVPDSTIILWQRTLDAMKADGSYVLIERKYGTATDSVVSGLKIPACKRPKNSQLCVITEENPPFNFRTENGSITGQSTDIMRQLLIRMNKSVEIELTAWDEGYEFTLTESNVSLFSTTKTPQRESLFKWVGPIVSSYDIFYAKNGSNITITSLDDARRVPSICGYKDDARMQVLQANSFTNLVLEKNNDACIKKLVSGDVSVWAGAKEGVSQVAAKAGVDVTQVKPIYQFSRKDYYIAFSNDTPNMEIAKWQQALYVMRADGTYQTIAEEYGQWLLGN